MIFTKDTSAQHAANYTAKSRALLAEMTLEEKALLLSGDGWWHTHPIERLQIPALSISDGPHGLRKVEGAGLPTSVPATCFPTASALASSWDPELIGQVGAALAKECQAHDVQVLLGPGVNMKRSPLAGRNFEYFSEDPLLAGKMAAAYILGVQSLGVGTSLKHYAANNQEFERMETSSNLDERTLHELYLPAFEIAVKEAQPWSVMAAYNLVNHVHATENSLLLRDILRTQWGFQGFVVSDWGAVHDGVAGVDAGLSLEMPGSGDYLRNKIIEAVRAERLSPAKLDEAVMPLLTVILKAKDHKGSGVALDTENHDALARRAAAESLVLLKNSGGLLPLDLQRIKSIALIGAFAKAPRYQGSGSSQVNPTRISTAYEELVKLVDKNTEVRYAAGYTEEGTTTENLIEEARRQAKAVEVAIVFAGLPNSYECEGLDRSSLEMPAGHNQLIAGVSAAQPNVAVVLMNGSAVTMPWAEKVRAILEGWLGGQAGGGAIADVLTGRVNPSGKLAETFPARLEDTPPFPDFPSRTKEANYGEGIFIGYRYSDARNIAPLFPFGFGLSYTTFVYSALRVGARSVKETDPVTVEVQLKNTGPVAGQEVVQLYIHEQCPKVVRPEKELKAFTKLALQAGEERTVSFQLTRRDFAHYDTFRHDWVVNPGKFEILVGSSSQDLPLRETITLEVTQQDCAPLSRYSMLKDFEKHPKGKAFYPQLAEAFGLGKPDEADMAVRAFLDDMPVYKVCAFSQGKFTEEMLKEILKQVQ
jgi:beta-glucosidase